MDSNFYTTFVYKVNMKEDMNNGVKNIITKLLPVCALLSLMLNANTACSSEQAGKKQSAAIAADTVTTLVLPAIPAMLSTPELRADYLARHYWDNVDFADTNYIHRLKSTVSPGRERKVMLYVPDVSCGEISV